MSQRKDDDWMGTPLPRKEDRRLLTGKGKYVSDIVIPGALHAVFVRSEYAHAKILSIDTSEAEELAGIERIYTGDQIKHLIKSMPQPIVQPALRGM